MYEFRLISRYLFADDEDLVMAAEKSPDSPTTDVVLSGWFLFPR